MVAQIALHSNSTLEYFIRHYGSPIALFSDNAKSKIGKSVLKMLHMYTIKDFHCEPHHQNQNYAEHRIQDANILSMATLC
jgi:hypothetical protein